MSAAAGAGLAEVVSGLRSIPGVSADVTAE